MKTAVRPFPPLAFVLLAKELLASASRAAEAAKQNAAADKGKIYVRVVVAIGTVDYSGIVRTGTNPDAKKAASSLIPPLSVAAR